MFKFSYDVWPLLLNLMVQNLMAIDENYVFKISFYIYDEEENMCKIQNY